MAELIAAVVLAGALFAGRFGAPIAVAALLALAAFAEPQLTACLLTGAHTFKDGRRAGVVWSLALIVALEAGIGGDGAAVPALLITVSAWAAGRALGERERVAAQLATRTRELDSEQELHAQLSVQHERTRIAAELHDIVAHAISIMVVQASAGQRLSDPSEALDNIARAAHQAEQELGRLVTLLADEDASAPDLDLVRELVRNAAATGLEATVDLEGDTAALPAEVAELAYRVAQEGLTNALRYAAGAPVHVQVRRDEELTVEVTNGRAPRSEPQLGGGHGLPGLRARLAAQGGALQAGPTPAGGWRLAARIPVGPQREP